MKRSCTILAVLGFCLLLGACGRQPSKEYTYKDTYPYGNMQRNGPPGNYARMGDESFINFTSGKSSKGGAGSRLFTYDCAADQLRLFCKDATCNHQTQDCAAYGAEGNLEAYAQLPISMVTFSGRPRW